MTALLDSIKYAEHEWKRCGDLKVIAVLFGMQPAYTKYCCFLCTWGNRYSKAHYIEADCWCSPATTVTLQVTGLHASSISWSADRRRPSPNFQELHVL
ncbi:hypothetical protein FHG87_001439 [Trinorchestia longiramus]|nr:hypothetical protein FHG87_001439 [Trinorchestia longiramus]